MKIYLTKDTLNTGKIVEVEATVLTGRVDKIQVTGVSLHERIVSKPHWHTTIETARQHMKTFSAKTIDQYKDRIEWKEREIEEMEKQLKKLKLEAIKWIDVGG